MSLELPTQESRDKTQKRLKKALGSDDCDMMADYLLVVETDQKEEKTRRKQLRYKQYLSYHEGVGLVPLNDG